LVRQNRILFAIPVNEGTPKPHFASLPSIDLNRSITFLERRQPLAGAAVGEDKELDAILEHQHNTDFKSEYGTLPFWRLIILQIPGQWNEFTASFIYHHAIGDGVSGLALHNAFRNALDAASFSCLPGGKTEKIIVPDANAPVSPPLEELHSLPLNPAPPPPDTSNLKEWTGNSIRSPCKSHWASFYLSPSASKAFVQECKERNISVTSALSSVVATVFFGNLPSTVDALTCIIPVNLRPWLKLPREVANVAIGTYFDATRARLTCSSQISRDPSLAEVWSGAQQVSKSINDYLCNVSLSGEPYTSVSVLKTIPDVSLVLNSMLGKPRDAAFEVTNVGVFTPAVAPKTKENTSLWQVGKVLLSRSSAVTGAAVTVTVATGGNESMALGFSWQEGVLEDGFVDIIKQGVRKYFEKYQ
jgi:hypothetical protein